MREDKNKDGGVDINTLVSDNDGKKQHVDEGKGNEALKKL